MDIDFLQDIIVSRDEDKNGMFKVEVITLIGDLVQCPKRAACKKHQDKLVRSRKMKQSKAEGKMKKDQNSNAKRTQVTVE